jgi:hypothetical protein
MSSPRPKEQRRSGNGGEQHARTAAIGPTSSSPSRFPRRSPLGPITVSDMTGNQGGGAAEERPPANISRPTRCSTADLPVARGSRLNGAEQSRSTSLLSAELLAITTSSGKRMRTAACQRPRKATTLGAVKVTVPRATRQAPDSEGGVLSD